MYSDLDVPKALSDLMELAPAGFAIGLHMGFTAPTFMFQTYPKDWAEEYSREGMAPRDPTVAWGFSNEGAVDWRDLAGMDESGILARAREKGLRHGVTISLIRGTRTIGSFSRADRPFSPEEIERLGETLDHLHDGTASVRSLPEPVRESLRRLSVVFTHP